jgi:DNA-binding transcriptional regulator YdaS (Cro superfamily)
VVGEAFSLVERLGVEPIIEQEVEGGTKGHFVRVVYFEDWTTGVVTRLESREGSPARIRS